MWLISVVIDGLSSSKPGFEFCCNPHESLMEGRPAKIAHTFLKSGSLYVGISEPLCRGSAQQCLAVLLSHCCQWSAVLRGDLGSTACFHTLDRSHLPHSYFQYGTWWFGHFPTCIRFIFRRSPWRWSAMFLLAYLFSLLSLADIHKIDDIL